MSHIIFIDIMDQVLLQTFTESQIVPFLFIYLFIHSFIHGSFNNEDQMKVNEMGGMCSTHW
jgi:hypothetical protein